jgi:hypothetical protein
MPATAAETGGADAMQRHARINTCKSMAGKGKRLDHPGFTVRQQKSIFDSAKNTTKSLAMLVALKSSLPRKAHLRTQRQSHKRNRVTLRLELRLARRAWPPVAAGLIALAVAF